MGLSCLSEKWRRRSHSLKAISGSMILLFLNTQWLWSDSPHRQFPKLSTKTPHPEQWVHVWAACMGLCRVCDPQKSLFPKLPKWFVTAQGWGLSTDVRASPLKGCISKAFNYDLHRRLTDVIIVFTLWLNSFCMSSSLRFSFSVLYDLYKELTCVFSFLEMVPQWAW